MKSRGLDPKSQLWFTNLFYWFDAQGVIMLTQNMLQEKIVVAWTLNGLFLRNMGHEWGTNHHACPLDGIFGTCVRYMSLVYMCGIYVNCILCIFSTCILHRLCIQTHSWENEDSLKILFLSLLGTTTRFF